MSEFSDKLKDLLHNKLTEQEHEMLPPLDLQEHLEEVNKLLEEEIYNSRKKGIYRIAFRIPSKYYKTKKFIFKNLTKNLLSEGFYEYKGSFDNPDRISSKNFSLTKVILFGFGGDPEDEVLVQATIDDASGLIIRL